jgi:multidrug efflux pump
MDFSINLLTLLAMILAIGMVVDDAIVVLENIFRRIQQGESPLLAALKGTRQVGFAVIATTLVLVAVFVPITFMQGNTGRLFSEFAIALTGAVCLSSLVALTLSPMMCSRILKPRPPKLSVKNNRLTRLQEAASERYGRMLAALMHHKWVVAVVLAMILISIPLTYTLLDKEYSPLEDRGAFFVIADGPEGAGFEKSYEMLERMEEVLMTLYEKGEATRVLLRLPASFSSTNEVNTASGESWCSAPGRSANAPCSRLWQMSIADWRLFPDNGPLLLRVAAWGAAPESRWNSYWVAAITRSWPGGATS